MPCCGTQWSEAFRKRIIVIIAQTNAEVKNYNSSDMRTWVIWIDVLPRTQARSSRFVSDSRAIGAILVGITGKVKKKNVFLAHPSQRPLRQRYTFPWSISRYSLIARRSRVFRFPNTWDAKERGKSTSTSSSPKPESLSMLASKLDNFKGESRVTEQRDPSWMSLIMYRLLDWFSLDFCIISLIPNSSNWWLIKSFC